MKATNPASIAVSTIMSMVAGPVSSPSTVKPAILCLHGRQQNAAMFALKISGARKKLSRIYECDFLDGPIITSSSSSSSISTNNGISEGRAWFERDESGTVIGIEKAFDHVAQHVQRRREEGKVEYSAILGFSQGGTLAASLAVSGREDIVPNIGAVITAGSPMIDEAAEYALNPDLDCSVTVSMLHFAGKTDAMVPIDSTERLSDALGVGEVRIHDRGHMFPTRSADVKMILDFLERHVDCLK